MTESRTPRRRAAIAIAATRARAGERSLSPLPLHRFRPLPERRNARRGRDLDPTPPRWLDRIELPTLGALRLGIGRGLAWRGSFGGDASGES